MKENRKRRHAVVSLALLLAVGLLGACGNSSKKSTSPASAPGQAATVGLNACTRCHTVVTADWMTSKHANLDPEDSLNSPGNPTLAQISGCTANCHEPNGDSARLVAGYTGNVARPVVGCEACHGAGSLHADAGGAGPIGLARGSAVIGTASTVAVSALFATCATCHELLDANDPANTPAASTHDPSSSVPPTGNQYTIIDTHFSKPSTTVGLFAINGYAMDYSSEKVCSDCHNPHKATNNTTEWAQSGHADRFVRGKDPQGYFTGAWSASNWSSNARCQRCHTTTGFIKYAGALSSGDQATIDGMIDGTVAALQPTTAFKPEMLKCNGCHTDTRGNLRNPGPVTARYDVIINYPASSDPLATYARVSFAYPDVTVSNLCLACHTGRESGESIKQLNLQPGLPVVDFNNLSFLNSHYLTGGGTVFTVTGYAFENRPYGNPGSYQHDQIGRNDFRSTGLDGPCKGCHMSRPNGNGNHLFLPVSRFNRVRTNAGTVAVTADSAIVAGVGTTWDPLSIVTGTASTADVFRAPDSRVYQIANVDSPTQITLTTPYRGSTSAAEVYVIAKDGLRIAGIASEACFNCHAGTSTLLVDQLNEAREQFEDALHALEHALDKNGFCFLDASPYFFKRRTNAGLVSVTTGSIVVTGAGTLFSTAATSANTDKFRTYDGATYDIQSVDSDTQITLKSPYLGATASGVSYAIAISGSSNAVKDWPGADNDATGAASGKNNMGAAFNLNLLEHDPGAYVHNRTYVKRLIYDALDWLDDNTLNYSAGTTLNAAGPEPYKTKAIQYILPNGVLGIAAERP